MNELSDATCSPESSDCEVLRILSLRPPRSSAALQWQPLLPLSSPHSVLKACPNPTPSYVVVKLPPTSYSDMVGSSKVSSSTPPFRSQTRSCKHALMILLRRFFPRFKFSSIFHQDCCFIQIWFKY